MSRKKILILDDDPVVVKALSIKLEAGGYQPLSATDPETALRMVRTENPDLLIVDIHLPTSSLVGPTWSGFTLVQWLERLNQDWHKPVIIISADDPAKHQDKAKQIGAVAFFQKPIDHDKLLGTIASALNTGTSAAAGP
ncbi:MAG: hypothetical protein KatS3mg132_803 [Limisphaera sp.]|nr:MAG: hypothetical protein KatS3mg132_803 [Limisphaera sp.]